MKRYLSGTVPYVKTSVAIYGENQIDAFEALCHATNRRPHELAHDVVLAYVLAHRDNPAVAESIMNTRAARAEADEENATVQERRAAIRLVR